MKDNKVLKGIFSLIVLIALLAVLTGGPIYIITSSVRKIIMNHPLGNISLSGLFTSCTFTIGFIIIIAYCETRRRENNSKFPKNIKKLLFGEITTAIIVILIVFLTFFYNDISLLSYSYLNIALAVISLINFIASLIILIRYVVTGK